MSSATTKPLKSKTPHLPQFLKSRKLLALIIAVLLVIVAVQTVGFVMRVRGFPRSPEIIGADLNNNGIRDDVDTYIASLSITAEQKKAIEQDARALQATLLVDTNNSNALRQASSKISRVVRCLGIRFPDFYQRRSIYTKIEAITINTMERSSIYNQYNDAVSGSVFPSLTEDTCDN
jgi:hypothetical protein